MSLLMVMAAAGFVILACFKAYQSIKLMERDPEAYARWQQVEEEKRRCRQQALGNATMKGINMVKGWMRKEERPEE